jgi:hypothetical protein
MLYFALFCYLFGAIYGDKIAGYIKNKTGRRRGAHSVNK